MKHQNAESFVLDNFEGPIDFLLHLIQKEEIDIYDVPLSEITQQYLFRIADKESPDIDTGGEFVSAASSLLWIKSKTLLPKHEQQETLAENDADPRFEIIHQLIDYCKFKQAAKELSQRELQQNAFYPRGGDPLPDIRKNLGIEHLSLQDLASLFQNVLSKAVSQKGTVQEEIWRVSDKILYLRQRILDEQKIDFELLFNMQMSREELIVTFLATLELMKMGEIRVVKDVQTQKVVIIA